VQRPRGRRLDVAANRHHGDPAGLPEQHASQPRRAARRFTMSWPGCR
jgi:hypothetical protein